MVTNFIAYAHYLMPILNGYKFYYVYASTFNAYLEWLQILLCIHVLIFFGGGPRPIVVLRGPISQKGA